MGEPIYKEFKEGFKEVKEDLSSSRAPGKTEQLIRSKLQGWTDELLAENDERRKWFDLEFSSVTSLVKQASRTQTFKRKLVQLLDLHAGITDFEPKKVPGGGAKPERKPWDVTGGDAQNRHHPDYKPVRGQRNERPKRDEDAETRQREHHANNRKNDLYQQAASLLGIGMSA